MNPELLPLHTASPAELADLAAEAVRALNHATVPGQARLAYPSDVYDTLAALRRLAERLPQALAQLARWLDAEATAGRLTADSGRKPALVLTEVADACAAGGHAADAMARDLSAAQTAAAGLATAREGGTQ